MRMRSVCQEVGMPRRRSTCTGTLTSTHSVAGSSTTLPALPSPLPTFAQLLELAASAFVVVAMDAAVDAVRNAVEVRLPVRGFSRCAMEARLPLRSRSRFVTMGDVGGVGDTDDASDAGDTGSGGGDTAALRAAAARLTCMVRTPS